MSHCTINFHNFYWYCREFCFGPLLNVIIHLDVSVLLWHRIEAIVAVACSSSRRGERAGHAEGQVKAYSGLRIRLIILYLRSWGLGLAYLLMMILIVLASKIIFTLHSEVPKVISNHMACSVQCRKFRKSCRS